jgi:hypothetical protein
MVIGVVLLALGVGGRARALETEVFEARLAEVVAGQDTGAALRGLDALAAEALQAGRLDLRVLATAAHARERIRAGEFSRVRQDLDEARSEARSGGWPGIEAAVCEVYGDFWQSQGDPVAAAEWLDAAWSLALASPAGDVRPAIRVLERLSGIRSALGQEHLAAQARAWLALLTGAADAPPAEIVLQPTSLTTQVASDEVGRARLFLANATPSTVTGTLLIEGGDLVVRQWSSHSNEERVTLQFPAAGGAVPQSTAQGRKLTLRPGESRTLILEVEPNTPPRPGARTVSATWQAGSTSVTGTAHFHFRRSRELPSTSVANACLVRLSPLVSVPVHMEVYHRGRPQRHIQDILPVTSQPCRVEMQEILADGMRGRQWLAVDGDGDGSYGGVADAVVVDANDSGYPDVEFSEEKEVAALEARLYPLPSADGLIPPALDLTVSLRDGDLWRQPADVSHRVESAE